MIKKNPVTEEVMFYMMEQIRSGSWPVDSKIPSENQLCEILGVSRTSIRAALQRYNVLGVLESRHGSGTFVRTDRVLIPGTHNMKFTAPEPSEELTRNSFREWRQARNIVEPEIAFRVAETASPEFVEKLRRLNREQEQLIGNKEAFIKKDCEYHLTLANYLGNRLVAQYLRSLLEMQEMLNFGNDRFGYMGGVYFHAMITDAIAHHDAKRARTLMLEHGRDQEEFNRRFGVEENGSTVAEALAEKAIGLGKKEEKQK